MAGVLTPSLRTLGFSHAVPFPQTESDFQVVRERFPTGESQAWINGVGVELRAWSLPYGLTKANFLTLKAFWDARQGEYEVHYWDDPFSGEDDIKVAFSPGQQPRWNRRWVNWGEVTLTIIEVA